MLDIEQQTAFANQLLKWVAESKGIILAVTGQAEIDALRAVLNELRTLSRENSPLAEIDAGDFILVKETMTEILARKITNYIYPSPLNLIGWYNRFRFGYR